MIWLAMTVMGMAFMLMKLGALSVWVSILSLALRIALFVLVVLTGVFLWRKSVGARG